MVFSYFICWIHQSSVEGVDFIEYLLVVSAKIFGELDLNVPNDLVPWSSVHLGLYYFLSQSLTLFSKFFNDSYWFTATSCFCWSSLDTNVTWLPTRFVLDCPRGPMFGRSPPRWSVASSYISTSCHVTCRSRSTGGWCSSGSRSHLLPSRFCRPCGLVPAISCSWRRLWNTFCRGCGIAVKGKLRFSAVALHLCDAGADRISRSFAPNAG